MDLTLHVADADGMINLAGIVAPGAHYTAARNDNTGVVRLTPVRVLTPASKPVPVQEQNMANPECTNTGDHEATDPAPWPA